MNNMLPALIKCPNCKDRRDDVSLGSVTTDGYIIIKRKFNRHMVIMASEYSVICDCGYFIRIAEGKVTAEALQGTYLQKGN